MTVGGGDVVRSCRAGLPHTAGLFATRCRAPVPHAACFSTFLLGRTLQGSQPHTAGPGRWRPWLQHRAVTGSGPREPGRGRDCVAPASDLEHTRAWHDVR